MKRILLFHLEVSLDSWISVRNGEHLHTHQKINSILNPNAVVYNVTFWNFFWRVFPVEIRQEFIGIASLIASFCTMKASQGFSRVLNPNMQLKNHFNCNKSRFNLNFFRQIPSPESPKSRIIDNSTSIVNSSPVKLVISMKPSEILNKLDRKINRKIFQKVTLKY